jgi:hypothetical protein
MLKIMSTQKDILETLSRGIYPRQNRRRFANIETTEEQLKTCLECGNIINDTETDHNRDCSFSPEYIETA